MPSVRPAAAAGASQLWGTARWSRMLFLVASIHESSFFVDRGGEACGLSFPVICALVFLLNSSLERPSSSLPLGEDADEKPHGMMVRPPLMGDGCRLRPANGCRKGTSLARPLPFVGGGRTGLPTSAFEVWVGQAWFSNSTS